MTAYIQLPVKLEALESGDRRLLEDKDVLICTVPKGFVSDLSSIPWYGRFIVRWSKVDLAGLVHDYLYYSQTTTRYEADAVWMLIAMSGENRANWAQAFICYLALRLFGWIAWRRHAK